MSVSFQNTLTRRLEPFEPMDPDHVRVYACGPTIYDYPHIGNYRTFVVFDLLHRYLKWRGYGVHFVQNLTDVDDKTIDGAVAKGVSLSEFTVPFGEAFLEDGRTLGIQPVDSYPRATEYVEEMVQFIQVLMEKGLAYTTEDGSVYFDISEFPGYGKLSGMDVDAVRSGERVASDDYGKDDARDFALWKAAKPKDMEVGAVWDAPWGKGRPGWHLECSVMGLSELGETLDIHFGGEDLVFPHHEDEIAQSEGATGQQFVRYWLHVKHLIFEGEKMSKSLGNTVTVGHLTEQGYEPAAIRHQLISAQYRSEVNFTMSGLDGSMRAVQRLVDFAERLDAVRVADDASDTRLSDIAGGARDRFQRAMDNDLNSAEGLAAVFVFLNEVNGVLDAAGDVVRPEEKEGAVETLASMDSVLGILELARAGRTVDAELERWVGERIQAREDARRECDFQAADTVRDELAAKGIVLEDTPEGTRWKVVRPG